MPREAVMSPPSEPQTPAPTNQQLEERLRAAERSNRRLRWMFLLAVVALMLVVGVALFLMQQRRAEQASAVMAALERAATLRDQARWERARQALQRAQTRLGEHGLDDVRQRWQRVHHDLELAARLDRATPEDGNWNNAGADNAYAAAVRDAGLALEGWDVAAVAGRLRATAIRA